MKYRWYFIFIACVALPLQAASSASKSTYCGLLIDFVKSVKTDETREFVFRTSWGRNFNDVPDKAIYAKRCNHNDYLPAKNVCDYLMRHGLTEFSNYNVMSALTCLSPKTRFARNVQFNHGELSFSYGTENRGSLVDIQFYEDPEIGGMAFKLSADGY